MYIRATVAGFTNQANSQLIMIYEYKHLVGLVHTNDLESIQWLIYRTCYQNQASYRSGLEEYMKISLCHFFL